MTSTYRPYPGHPLEQPAPYPSINPDRRACAGCVGPGGVASLVEKLRAVEAEVERLRVCMRAPLLASGRLGLADTSATPNERAYAALMAERQKRKRAGADVGRLLRIHNSLMDIARSRVVDAEYSEREVRAKAQGVPLLQDKIDRLKAENLRLLNNEAPLRAGYVEACAERDALRWQVATTREINRRQAESLLGQADELTRLRRVKADKAKKRRAIRDEAAREYNLLAHAVGEVLTNGHRPKVQVAGLLAKDAVLRVLAERQCSRAYTESDDDYDE